MTNPDRIGPPRWVRATIVVALLAFVWIPATSAGHAHLFPQHEVSIGLGSGDPAPATCQICRLTQERAIPAPDAGIAPQIARVGSISLLSVPVPPSVAVSNHASRAPPVTA